MIVRDVGYLHPLQGGRKLGSWGEKPQAAATATGAAVKDEDAEVQAAIAASLVDQPAGSGKSSKRQAMRRCTAAGRLQELALVALTCLGGLHLIMPACVTLLQAQCTASSSGIAW